MDIQVNQSGLRLTSGQYYTLSFWAKADQYITAVATVALAHDPWIPLGYWERINLRTNWQFYTVNFPASDNEDNARVNFEGFCSQTVTVWIARVSLKPGGGPALVVSTARLPSGTTGVQYSQSIQAMGGVQPYTWSLASGSLPEGHLLSTNGQIVGNSSAPVTTHFQVQVQDALRERASMNLSLTVNPPGTECYWGAVSIDGNEAF